MARVNVDRKTTRRSPPAGCSRARKRQFQLLRYSHIFASVVREILELKFLREATPHSLTLSQFHLVKAITLNGGYQIGEVAGFLGVSPPAATKSINKLEGLGLIVRSPSRGDRRATLLSPSARGRRLVQKYEELKGERLRPVLDEFSPDELERMTRLLERFSLSVIEREDVGSGLCLHCAAYCDEDCAVGEVRGGCPYERVRAAHADSRAAGETS